MSRAFNRYWNARIDWNRAAQICVGLALLFAIVRWWRG